MYSHYIFLLTRRESWAYKLLPPPPVAKSAMMSLDRESAPAPLFQPDLVEEEEQEAEDPKTEGVN